jgi:hypothetical protein
MPARKTVEVSDKVKGEAPFLYHPMVRWLGAADIPERNIFTAETVKKHIKIWTDQGYRIHTSQHISTQRDEESGVAAEGIYFLFEYMG